MLIGLFIREHGILRNIHWMVLFLFYYIQNFEYLIPFDYHNICQWGTQISENYLTDFESLSILNFSQLKNFYTFN